MLGVKVEIICHQKKNKEKCINHLRVLPSDIILLIQATCNNIMRNELIKMDWLKYMQFRPNETDSEAVYKQLWTRIEENASTDHPEIKIKTNKIWWLYKIAAVMLLLLGLSGLYFLTLNFSQEEMLTLQSGSKCIQTIKLSDGTIVKLGPNSRFTYPKQFKKNTRNVEVNGQCFFDVKKDPKKPFIVHTLNMEVTVLGTQFEIFNYEQENKVEVTLLSGKVEVETSTVLEDRKHIVNLYPNQKIVLDKKDNSIHIEEINAAQYLTWQESGILSFENESLSVIIPRIEQWFGCRIVFPEVDSNNLRVTFKIKSESLEEALNIISLTTKYKYRQKADVYEFY